MRCVRCRADSARGHNFFLLHITLNSVLFLLALELVESWYIIEAIVGIHVSFLIVMGLFLGFDL